IEKVSELLNQFREGIPDFLQSPMDALKEAISIGDSKAVNDTTRDIFADIQRRREQLSALTGKKKEEEEKKLQIEEQLYNGLISSTGANSGGVLPNFSSIAVENFGQPMTPGDIV